MDSRDVVVVSGTRTAFVKAKKDLKDVHPVDLGTTCLKSVLDLISLEKKQVDEVIIGNTANPSDAANISRVIALRAGLPQSVSAYTVHRNCASGLQSIADGFDKIKTAQADVVVVGGVESMSNMPLLFSKELTKILETVFSKSKNKFKVFKELRLKHLKPRIAIMEGLTDPFCGLNMGETAQKLAREFNISRQEQDEFALQSHKKATEAISNGLLSNEITPVFVGPSYKKVVDADVGPRADQTYEALSKLKPFFDKRYGTVTVGNSCPITDGAALLVLMSYDKANSMGLKSLAKIRGYDFAGLEPERMGLGPVYATAKLLKRQGFLLSDMNLVELNEAFAAQVLACLKAFDSSDFAKTNLGLESKLGEIDLAKLNPNGGAIALGHPVGATGGRLVLSLANRLKQNELGLATLCIGGGQGGAMILEGL